MNFNELKKDLRDCSKVIDWKEVAIVILLVMVLFLSVDKACAYDSLISPECEEDYDSAERLKRMSSKYEAMSEDKVFNNKEQEAFLKLSKGYIKDSIAYFEKFKSCENKLELKD